MGEIAVVVSCEHAFNRIPRKYAHLIYDEDVLDSHEGYDIGALSYAKIISTVLKAPLVVGSYTRLLVDLNRSFSNPHLFSRYSCSCSTVEKNNLIRKYYEPFRRRMLAAISSRLSEKNRVLHLSCHTFTPYLRDQRRAMDLGILYDPGRKQEVAFSDRLFQCLRTSTSMRIRRNAPYRGDSDGHVACLRRHFSADCYIGIELEVNQSFFISSSPIWKYVWLPALCREVFSICYGRQ